MHVETLFLLHMGKELVGQLVVNFRLVGLEINFLEGVSVFHLDGQLVVALSNGDALGNHFAGRSRRTNIMTTENAAVGDAELDHQLFLAVLCNNCNIHKITFPLIG